MSFLKHKPKGPPCSCGATSEREHENKMSALEQIRGRNVPRSKPHKYTGPK